MWHYPQSNGIHVPTKTTMQFLISWTMLMLFIDSLFIFVVIFLYLFFKMQLWSTFHEPEQVEKAFQRSFDNLNLGYIDLYLIHYPVAYRRVLRT